MTEIQLQKRTFLTTLQTIREKFELASPIIVLETDEAGTQFALTAKRVNAPEVRAFGPCVVKGPQLNVEFDMADLESAITSAAIEADELTLLIGDGLWVKETVTADTTQN